MHVPIQTARFIRKEQLIAQGSAFLKGHFEAYQQSSFVSEQLVSFSLAADYEHFIALLTCALAISTFETCPTVV